MALKDKNNNNKFNPKEDKMGLERSTSRFLMTPFTNLNCLKRFSISKHINPTSFWNRLVAGYNGTQNLKEQLPQIILKNKSQILESIVTQMPKKDSLQIWFKPLKVDSLTVNVSKKQLFRRFRIKKIKDQKKTV
jgi:hypothetical protein